MQTGKEEDEFIKRFARRRGGSAGTSQGDHQIAVRIPEEINETIPMKTRSTSKSPLVDAKGLLPSQIREKGRRREVARAKPKRCKAASSGPRILPPSSFRRRNTDTPLPLGNPADRERGKPKVRNNGARGVAAPRDS